MENSLDFKETLELLRSTQWLYKDPVTEILVHGYLDSFPNGWLEIMKDLSTEELNDVVVNNSVKNHWPVGLKHFVETCKRLNKLSSKTILEPPNLPNQFRHGLSIKKQHEIYHLAKLTHEKCMEAGLKTIVDLGAGLGYICQILNHMYGYRVLGLESSASNKKTAEERQISLYPKSLADVKYVCTRITEKSSMEIEALLSSFVKNENEGICLIGLHSCADLSVDACKLFSEMSSAKLLIMVSCCYHKLKVDENTKTFKNFPLSRELKTIIKDYGNEMREVLNRPFLRLACQEPAERWEGMSKNLHEEHAFCVLARGVLELFVHQNEINLKKRVRKATRKSQCLDFDTYVADFFVRYTFDGENLSDSPEVAKKIKEIWEENKQKLYAAEIYTGLQLLLQAPAESLILNDRQAWLMEQGYKSQIVPVLNSKISPRCHAIVSRKP